MYPPTQRTTRTGRRALAALAVPFLILATVFAAAPAAAAAGVSATATSTGTGDAEVTIVAGTYDFYFVGTAASVYGEVNAVDPADGAPTGTVRVISNEPGSHTEEHTLLDDGSFYSDVYPTEIGTRTFTVEYSGDDTFAPATATFDYFVPTGPDTKTTLTADPSGPILAGQSITFTAQVTDSQGRPLDGPRFGEEITFYANGEPLTGEQTWGEWESTLTTELPVGTHRITAVTSAVFYETSTSNELVIEVVMPERERVKGTLSIWPNGIISSGTAVHAVARFHTQPDTGVVTGHVQFYDFRSKVGAPVELVGGEARFDYDSLGSGPHLLIARYLGTEQFHPAMTIPRFVYVRR
jgi:hypothetical protein